MWLLSTRNWIVTEDWKYNIDGTEYVIPAGFQFDGASIPKFLRSFFSPVGVLLIGGLVHDYAYKYKTLLRKTKKTQWVNSRKREQMKFSETSTSSLTDSTQ